MSKINFNRLQLTTIFYLLLVALFAALPALAEDSCSIPLPTTGQTTCYDTMGNIVSCTGTGQDGEIQAGIAWPDPRFTDNGNQTVTDNLTGLIWAKDAGTPEIGPCAGGAKNWQEALDYVACLNANSYLGFTDWILPNKSELASLVNYGPPDLAAWLTSQGFTNIQTGTTDAVRYWSSSTLASNTDVRWIITFGKYYVGESGNWKTNTYYIWPVRAEQPGSSAIVLPKTGQTTSYAAHDDGALQRGAVWPSPRFSDNGNQTIKDNLTGLFWTTDGNAPGPLACGSGSAKTWQEALDYVACLNTSAYLGFTDWRLPNVIELKSLTNLGQSDAAAWLTAQGFTNVQYDAYWSSTTSFEQATAPGYTSQAAWLVNVSNNHVSANFKEIAYYAWPVRGGEADTTPPHVTVTATPNILWPPNHKMVDIFVNGSASDDESGLASVVITVTDEYGEYNMTVPGFGSTIKLEAWREGTDADGRVYTITVVATDCAGNQSSASSTVIVPHDMRK